MQTEKNIRKKGSYGSLEKKQMWEGIGFILPFLAGFLVFFLIPFVWCVCYSFTSGIGGTEFAGFGNYRSVFGSKAFRLASYNTLRFMAVGVTSLMLLSFALALLLFKGFRGVSFFRVGFLFPLVVPVATLVMTVQLVIPTNSVGSYGKGSFWVLVALYVWKNCGYNIILLLAGLAGIPQDLFQVARLEGASGWQVLRKITIPLMVPMFFFTFVVSVANSFKCFREAYILGGDRPDYSIYMLQHFMNNNYHNLNYQRLSVAALFVFALILVILLVLFAIKKKYLEVEL